MTTIKGEIPKELEKKFRKLLYEKTGLKKGSISKALQEAMELWVERQEQILKSQSATSYLTYQELIQKNAERYIILDFQTDALLSKGNDVIEAVKEAKSKCNPPHKFKILSKSSFTANQAQLGWRVKSRLKT